MEIFAVAGFAPEASALVPRADRIIKAVVKANISGRRVRALRYELKLRIGDGPPVADGELVTHPTGLARLELRAGGGLVERHILLGNQHNAARNARVLVRPRAFLPPLFVMQSNSGAVLEAALGTLGVDRKIVGLAPCGDSDCYVIGDPSRAVRKPRFEEPIPASAETLAKTDEASDLPPGTMSIQKIEPTPDETEPAPEEFFPSLWVDTEDHSIRQIESRDGVRIVLGPYVSFEHLKVPKWWRIEEPGKRPVRFDVEGVVEVNAPAAAFSKTWLMAPVGAMGDGTPSAQADEPEGVAEEEAAPADLSSP